MELNNRIKRLIDEKGFKKLTEPQEKAIPHILKGENVLIIAPTGSGKTEAAFIPILHLMLEKPGPPIRTIYITPLRSLNRDLIDRLIWWASRLDFSIVVRHGDTPRKERRLHTIRPPDIMITTPETFSYLLNTKILSNYLLNVNWVVVDELHELIPSKRGVQLSINLERLRRIKPDIQVIGLSATVGNPEKALEFLTGVGGKGVIVETDIVKRINIDISYPTPTVQDQEDSIRLYTYPEVAARVRRIWEKIDEYGKVLIFTNTRPMAEILGNRLLIYDEELPISVHHSSIGADYRIRVEEKFKTGGLKAIVATSSLELGIDIGDIKYVIQYGSPRQASKLIQRVGRSGHWIEEISRGEVLAIDQYDFLESVAIRDRVYRGEIERLDILKSPYDVLIHEVIGLLIKKGKVNINEIFEIIKGSIYYQDLTLEELYNLLKYHSDTLKLVRISGDYIYINNYKRLYRYYFENLSMIPDIKQYPVIDDATGKIVGVLDDEFMALNGEIGIKIILAGKPWKIIQIYNEKVYVKSEEDPLGAIPDWVGEEIPVPYEVAQEVGKILREFESLYNRRDFDEVLEILSLRLSVDVELIGEIFKDFKGELDRGYKLPNDRRITIEGDEKIKIVNIFGGTKVNRAIESYISKRIEELYGFEVRHTSDQYRVILESPLLDFDMVIRILKNPVDIDGILRKAIPESGIFRWRFLNVAKRMGYITKDADVTSTILDTMIRSMRGTPPYIEALKETLIKDFDIEDARKILNRVSNGYIEILSYPGYKSYMTLEHFKYREIPMESGRGSRYEMLEILATRLKIMSSYYVLACLECLEYTDEKRLSDLEEGFKCPICGSKNIGFTVKPLHDVMASIERFKATGRVDSVMRELRRRGKLYMRYGLPGVYASFIEGLTVGDIEKALKIETRIGDKLTKILLDLRRERMSQRFHGS